MPRLSRKARLQASCTGMLPGSRSFSTKALQKRRGAVAALGFGRPGMLDVNETSRGCRHENERLRPTPSDGRAGKILPMKAL